MIGDPYKISVDTNIPLLSDHPQVVMQNEDVGFLQCCRLISVPNFYTVYLQSAMHIYIDVEC